MKRFVVFSNLHLPRAWSKVLAWMVMGFGLLVFVTGIIVRDEAPAMAQAGSQAESEAEAAPLPGGEHNLWDGLVGEDGVQDRRLLYMPEEEIRGDAMAVMERKRTDRDNEVGWRFMSIFGIFGLIGIAWLMSNNRKKVIWKAVAVGTAIQLAFAMFILWTPIGKAIFAGLNSVIVVLLDFTRAGTAFLFSSYVSGTIESAHVNTAMSVLPPIIFFSALMTMLYYVGVMQWIVRGIAVFMMKIMGTSGAETLSAVANIFVGQTEAPLVVKPYVARLTNSELFSVMTGGFATVAGGVMASYVAMLQPYFPDIAGHLIAASVMSAPATLVIAKVMFPETEEPETRGKADMFNDKQDANIIDAAARGASDGMQLAINVAAMLIAFVAIIALLNFLIGFPSRVVNAQTYEHVSGYLLSSEGTVDPACAQPYATSDTIACTHGALVAIADRRGIPLDEGLRILSGDQRHRIDQTRTVYDALIGQLSPPLADSSMVNDCRDGHSIAACGAVLAKTQDKAWTTALQRKPVWPLISLEVILGYLFFPIAFLMGVPLSDCFLVGQLLGEKMAINEFVAYLHLSQVIDQLSYRGAVIAIYALCGFANFGSIAIQIGGMSAMAPNRRSDLARLGIKAMIAGSIVAFMTATIAGALI